MDSKDFKPSGTIPISNHGGAEIMLNNSQDRVHYRFNFGQDLEKEEIMEAEIQDDQEGEPYFISGRTIYYLNQMIKATVYER